MLAIAVTGCQPDIIDGFHVDDATEDSGSVITMATGRADGIVNLSVDAPARTRFGVWIDLDGNGERAEDGAEDVKVFNAYQDYILASGLKTVSIYGDVTYLGCTSNELTALDVSRNPSLVTLHTPLNRLTALDISKNAALTGLDCSGNSITAIDVSNNTALVSLWCFNNELSTLNLSNNADLAFLDCSGNKLSTLDVSKNEQLARLLAYNNELTSLDISQNSRLNRLWLFGNPFSDDETERIIGMLREVSQGDLWISGMPPGDGQAEALAAKGWELR
jgi:Leucine-rich repeat (LRR) protein